MDIGGAISRVLATLIGLFLARKIYWARMVVYRTNDDVLSGDTKAVKEFKLALVLMRTAGAIGLSLILMVIAVIAIMSNEKEYLALFSSSATAAYSLWGVLAAIPLVILFFRLRGVVGLTHDECKKLIIEILLKRKDFSAEQKANELNRWRERGFVPKIENNQSKIA